MFCLSKGKVIVNKIFKIVFLIFSLTLFGCSDSYPVIDSTYQSLKEYNEWVDTTFVKIEEDKILDYKEQSIKLVKQYQEDIKEDELNIVKRTDDLFDDLVELSEDTLSITAAEWNYLFQPNFTDDIPESMQIEIEVKLSQVRDGISRSTSIIIPLNILKAIPNHFKTYNDGQLYAQVLENTENKNFIQNPKWLKTYKVNQIIKLAIKNMNDSGEIDYDADNINQLAELREKVIDSQFLIDEYDVFYIEYDFSSYKTDYLHNNRYPIYKLAPLYKDLNKIKKSYISKIEKSKHDYYLSNVDSSKKYYEESIKAKEEIVQDTYRNQNIKNKKLKRADGVIEARKQELDASIKQLNEADTSLTVEELEKLEKTIARIKEFKRVYDTNFEKFTEYKDKYIKNYGIMNEFFKELETEGIGYFSVYKRFMFRDTNERLPSEKFLNQIKTISEDTSVSGYQFNRWSAEVYSREITDTKPLSFFIQNTKPSA